MNKNSNKIRDRKIQYCIHKHYNVWTIFKIEKSIDERQWESEQ